MTLLPRFPFAVLAGLLLTHVALADTPRAQTGAPYFEAWSAGEKIEALPLASTRMEAVIGGVIADVSLTQVYENRGTVPVEAVYVFPASSRATVYAVTMTVGNRVIRAKLRERNEARREYDAARESGRTATLLEQKDVGAFRMNVANVLPGDRISVELRYAELLVPTKGDYEFFFPNTAPQAKYSRAGDPDSTMPSSSAREVVDHAFSLKVHLLSGAPIASLASPSHPIVVGRPGDGEAVVTVDPEDARAGARDFVLRYSMLGDDIGTGVLAYRGVEENVFLLTAQPPRVVLPASLPPREYIFIVDVSGSMRGRPLDVSKALLEDLFATLRPDDRVNVILFAGTALAMSEQGSLPATPDTLKRAIETLRGTGAGGGTELANALELAYAIPPTRGMARSLVIVTDGAIAAGGAVSTLIASQLDQANAFVFGIGDYLDRATIDRLARAGQGEPFLVEQMSDAEDQARLLREYIDRPVLTQGRISWTGADLYDLEPVKLPDLFAERPIVVVGKYRGELAGKLYIDGYSGRQPVRLEVDLADAHTDPALSSLPLLWARRRIDRVQDAGACDGYSSCEGQDSVKQEVTSLGLRYGVLTPHTSFVAVTEEVRTDDRAERVDQPAAARDVESAAYGFDVALAASALAPVTGSAQWLQSPVLETRRIAGRDLVRDGNGWRDLAHRPDARILRIRRDSQAFRRLLVLRPELAELFRLRGRVLVSFGDWSVQVSPDGFGDYPAGVLEEALGARG